MSASVEYQIIIYDKTGARTAILQSFAEISFSKRLNKREFLAIRLHGNHPAISKFQLNYHVEVRRRDTRNDVGWYTEFYGFYRGMTREYSGNSNHFVTLHVVGQKDILYWSIVAYKGATVDRSSFFASRAETIMKQIVTYNCTTLGTTTDGRESDFLVSDYTVTIQVDGATGRELDWSCQFENVLDSLSDLAEADGPSDFDLVKTGATTWDFRYYYDRRGSDLSDSVKFNIGRGNMTNVNYEELFSENRRIFVIGGKGQNQSRETFVNYHPNYGVDGQEEAFINGSSFTSSEIESGVFLDLNEKQIDRRISFDPIDVFGTIYAKDYCVGGVLGDLVNVNFFEFNDDLKVVASNISYSSGKEKITLEFEKEVSR